MVLSRAMKMFLCGCSHWEAERSWSMADGSWLFLFVHLTVQFFLFCFVLGCRLKHTQELYNVRSCQGKVFNLVGIQSFGFECSLNIVWNVDFALWQKKRNTYLTVSSLFYNVESMRLLVFLRTRCYVINRDSQPGLIQRRVNGFKWE